MDLNPSYKFITQYTDRYPKLIQPLLQTYHDLTLSQNWFKVEFKEVNDYVLLIGRKSNKHKDTVIIPVHLNSNLCLDWLNKIMSSTDHSNDPQYLAISSSDGSVVYYRLNLGLMKPDDLRVV